LSFTGDCVYRLNQIFPKARSLYIEIYSGCVIEYTYGKAL
jgi:hypothetical protein